MGMLIVPRAARALRTNPDYEYSADRHLAFFYNTGVLEKIAEIEAEMKRTQKNKGMCAISADGGKDRHLIGNFICSDRVSSWLAQGQDREVTCTAAGGGFKGRTKGMHRLPSSGTWESSCTDGPTGSFR